MKELKDMDQLLRDVMEGKKEVKIRDGLEIIKPSDELDVIRIQVEDQAIPPELLDRKDLEEVIDFLLKRKDEDPLKSNPFIPDFD